MQVLLVCYISALHIRIQRLVQLKSANAIDRMSNYLLSFTRNASSNNNNNTLTRNKEFFTPPSPRKE
ncbi:hypothetical protein RND71_037545 [Anisodus tanguticus]|uniref:Uncharacterized protein n=1 Tax=Anisodus tanguticus TaxID=243964 RepID=A0AAE1R3X3_9SOLA|nr:hypothetical protein RND71_037545 [Anisodus tanguticus]